ncbi:MAG: hypothetical protein COC08_06050 [Maribacter sp.]|nr:MAG: hypothetical protein COC08_06050 [Maribacter sp.]
MKCLSKFYAIFFTFCLTLSCSKDERIQNTIENSSSNLEQDSEIQPPDIVDDKLQFSDEESLKQFILNTKPEKFIKQIKDLNTKGGHILMKMMMWALMIFWHLKNLK